VFGSGIRSAASTCSAHHWTPSVRCSASG
jgi:hypothetical protein